MPPPPPPPPGEGGEQPLPERGLGDILSSAFDIYGKNASRLLLIVALIVVPLSVVNFLLVRVALGAKKHTELFFGRKVTVVESRGLGIVLLALLIAIAINVITTAVLEAAMLRGAAQATVGDPIDVEASYRWGFRRIGGVIVLSLLVGLTVAVGFILFVIPGIIFLVMFSMSIPVLVVEGTGGTEAMRRSWKLVKGHFWHVLGVIVVAAIIAGIVGGLIGSIGGSTVVGLIFDIIGRVITAPFSALVTVLLYLDLRARGERLTESRLRAELGSSA